MMTEGTKKKMKAIQEMKLTNKPTINEVVLEMRALSAEIQTLKNEVKNASEVVNMLKLLVMDLVEMVSIEAQRTECKGVAATLQEIINNEPVGEITLDDYIPTYAESHSESVGGTKHSESTGTKHSESVGGTKHSESTGTKHSESVGGTKHSESVGGTKHSESTGTKHSESVGGTKHSESVGGTKHSESTGTKQQAVDFSEVAQEPIKALDTIPEDEFEFDFFDVVSPKEELSINTITQSGTDTSVTTAAVAGDVVNVPSESGVLNTTDAVASATGDIEEFDPLANR